MEYKKKNQTDPTKNRTEGEYTRPNTASRGAPRGGTRGGNTRGGQRDEADRRGGRGGNRGGARGGEKDGGASFQGAGAREGDNKRPALDENSW